MITVSKDTSTLNARIASPPLLGKKASHFLDTSPVRCRQGNAEEHGYFSYTVAGRREEDMDEQASTRQMYDGRNLRRHWTPRTISLHRWGDAGQRRPLTVKYNLII
jgi:hypothetical protein